MANNQKKEQKLYTPTEISLDDSDLARIISSPYFTEKDRRARERLAKSPIPEKFRKKN